MTTDELTREHEQHCSGVLLTEYLTTAGGHQYRVLAGRPCEECVKGRRLQQSGPGGLERAIVQAARHRGPAWITEAELAAAHAGAAKLPLWGLPIQIHDSVR